jgi:uncharacterized surface protein with fasciclin (FAS1) repeats
MGRMKLWVLPLVAALAACGEQTPTTPALEVGGRLESRGAIVPSAPAASPTLVDVALSVNASTGEFSTLIAAVLRAGLVADLSAHGQRTVFAPTDAAFAKLGLNSANIETVPLDFLVDVLLYHVAPGRREASSVVASDRIRMANGDFTSIRVQNGDAYINDSKIVAVNVVATNGIIHVIDTVLIP